MNTYHDEIEGGITWPIFGDINNAGRLNSTSLVDNGFCSSSNNFCNNSNNNGYLCWQTSSRNSSSSNLSSSAMISGGDAVSGSRSNGFRQFDNDPAMSSIVDELNNLSFTERNAIHEEIHGVHSIQR